MPNELILLTESDPVTARFLHSLLTEDGYEVLAAATVESAYRLVLDRKPRLILGDLTSPEDMYSLLRAVRRDCEVGNTPFVMLSVRNREEDVVRGFREGADDYVVKPFHARELLARVRRLLDRTEKSD